MPFDSFTQTLLFTAYLTCIRVPSLRYHQGHGVESGTTVYPPVLVCFLTADWGIRHPLDIPWFPFESNGQTKRLNKALEASLCWNTLTQVYGATISCTLLLHKDLLGWIPDQDAVPGAGNIRALFEQSSMTYGQGCVRPFLRASQLLAATGHRSQTCSNSPSCIKGLTVHTRFIPCFLF